jgi:hypothetical protein
MDDMKTEMKPNGVILYRGKSLIDGKPIVAIAVGLRTRSRNSKTGNMLQTYILRADVDPITALKSGKDVSICGACPKRGDGSGRGRTCYVNVGQGPMQVYKAYKRGAYPTVREMRTYLNVIGDKRVIRLGTYGDPGAVPADIWHALLTGSLGHTGYTHQWMHRLDLREICMASVDTVEEARQAHERGWRTFRVDESRVVTERKDEVLCPASERAGKKLTCYQCLSCAGADGRRGSVYIPAHGGFAVMANIQRAQS